MVERVYSHLGATRYRANLVEYRVEQHIARLEERLARQGAFDLPSGERFGEPAEAVTGKWLRSNSRP